MNTTSAPLRRVWLSAGLGRFWERMMSELMTDRGKALAEQRWTVEKKVCMAAADYLNALKKPEFSEVNGGTDALLNDLGYFVENWLATL